MKENDNDDNDKNVIFVCKGQVPTFPYINKKLATSNDYFVRPFVRKKIS